MSLVFIVIQIRARFDKSFLIFGIANLLLCSFSAIDIWLQPTTQILHWTKLQHIIASFFPPCITWYILLSVQKENLNLIRSLFILATLISLTFFTDLMLIQSGNEVVGTPVYTLIFAPYMLISIIGALIMSIRNLKKGTSFQRKFFFFHLFGIIVLSATGIADMSGILKGYRLITVIPCFSIIGILCFSTVVNFLFIEKLTGIILEREETFKKLRLAYKELEDVQVLKEIGQSAAMINHEIRNYAVAISGYAELLQMKGELNAFAQKMVNRISESVSRLANFSRDILEFSKSTVIKKATPVNLINVIKRCIDNNFEKSAEKFILDYNSSHQFIINGDWHKLDQVFVNLFKNSFEAGAENIKICLKRSKATLRCQVNDDGVGCSSEMLKNLFKAFHTSKKLSGGTGLGMCVVKSIIEGHGGRISAFSKQNNTGLKGLGLNLVFPADTDLPKDEKNGIIFVTQGIKELSIPLQIFRNALINPYIYNNVKDIDVDINFKDIYALIGTTECIHNFKSHFKTDLLLYALIEESNTGLFVLDDLGENDPVLFSEEFLLSSVVAKEYKNDSDQV
jgi:signal transduction histidine kinase